MHHTLGGGGGKCVWGGGKRQRGKRVGGLVAETTSISKCKRRKARDENKAIAEHSKARGKTHGREGKAEEG